jgi:hypothetical protein
MLSCAGYGAQHQEIPFVILSVEQLEPTIDLLGRAAQQIGRLDVDHFLDELQLLAHSHAPIAL